MRLVTFTVKSIPSLLLIGVELPKEGKVVNLSEAFGSYETFSMRSFLAMGDKGMAEAKAAVASGKYRVDIKDVTLKAPIMNPGKIVCIGMNYVDHCKEQNFPIPKEPLVFSKFSDAIASPGDDIPLENTQELDFEVELVIVIGKKARNVDKKDAMQYVAGYTVAHDVSARDWQLKKNGGQWLLGKSRDGYAPIGPAIVTDLKDPGNLGIRCFLNGKAVQDSNTKQLIFDTGDIIQFCTNLFTLEPGDIIFTGTPPGVGCFRKPPLWLKDGDVVKVEVDQIGSITNTVKAV